MSSLWRSYWAKLFRNVLRRATSSLITFVGRRVESGTSCDMKSGRQVEEKAIMGEGENFVAYFFEFVKEVN